MALSFLHAKPRSAVCTPVKGKRRVLVTGAAGNIGAYFAKEAHEKYDLVLMVHHPDHAREIASFGEIVTGDLSDLEGLTQLCKGVDTVVHMAGAASPSATWADLLPANIIGTYHLMVAARAAGCRRVIYASSIHAVSGTPRDVQVKTTDPVNPGDLYGVTKCFGEALARYMATQEGLSVFALRIGGFQPVEEAKKETGISMLDAFVTQRDMQQILEKCIDNTTLQFAIFNCLSGNRFNRLDITDTRELLGYRPHDDTTELNPQLEALNLDEKVVAHNEQDRLSGYQSGIRNDLERARAVLHGAAATPPSRKPPRKEPRMASKPSPKNGPSRKAEKDPRISQADPGNFGRKTTPVREKMAREVKEMPPEERIKRGR